MGYGLILLGMLLVLLGPPLVPGTGRRLRTPPAAQFLYQAKFECHYTSGMPRKVWVLDRFIYDRQEYVRFDSRHGRYETLTELGEPDAHYWNSRKKQLEYMKSEADAFCRHNYGTAQTARVVGRTTEPTVTISPTKGEPLAHHTLLICTATGYYPSGINIKWLKNRQEQTEGVGYADELQNADWTFQFQVMLETVPQRGDLYACQVEHRSRKEAITVQWEPQTSDSAKSKVWTGAVGAVLGLVFVAVGLCLYLKNRKDLVLQSGAREKRSTPSST